MQRATQATSAVASSQRGMKFNTLAGLAILAALPLASAQAVDRTWTGPGTDFADPANWGGAAPVDNQTADKGLFTGAPTANQPALTTARAINGLVFNTVSGGWTLGGAFDLSIGASGINALAQTSGTTTINAGTLIGANQSIVVGTGGTLEFNGNIAAVGGVGRNISLNSTSGGAGTLIFRGTGGNIGSPQLMAGTLILDGAGTTTLGSNLSVNVGSTLKLAGTGGNQIDQNRDLTIKGTFDLNDRSETVKLAAFDATGLITNTGTGAATLSIANSDPTFNGQITNGTGTLTLASTGGKTLTLMNGANTYSGGTTFASGGALVLGADNVAGTGAVSMSAGTTLRSNSTAARSIANTVTLSGNPVFGTSAPVTNGNLTVGSVSAGTNANLSVYNTSTVTNNVAITGGTITKAQAGNLVVKGNFTQSGVTALTISAGGIAVGGAYSNVGKAALNGGQLGLNGSLTAALNGANGVAWNNAADGGLFAFGNNAAWGNSANNLLVNFGGSGAAVTWNGTGSSFISTTKILTLGNTASNGTVSIANGINLNGATQSIQVTRGDTNASFAADAALNGLLTNGGLSLSGTGAIALSNANSYSGGTTSTAGKLLLTNISGSATGSGPVGINSGVLASGSVGSATGAVTLASGATAAPGDSAAGVLTVGALDLAGGSLLDFSQVGDLLNVTAAFTYSGSGTVQLAVPASLVSDYTLVNFGSTTTNLAHFAFAPGTDAGYSLQYSGNSLVVQVAAVPEPTVIGAVGLLATMWLGGRRRR